MGFEDNPAEHEWDMTEAEWDIAMNDANTFSTALTTATPTLEEIKAAVRGFIRNNEDHWPDVWVLTDAEYEKLKLHCEKHDSPITSLGITGWEPMIYGIRIEHYPTRDEVRARVLELADSDIKAGFIVESK